MLQNPKAGLEMVQDSDGFALGGGDLVIAPFKVDGVIVVDPAQATEGEVKIQQSGLRTGAEGAGFFAGGPAATPGPGLFRWCGLTSCFGVGFPFAVSGRRAPSTRLWRGP